LVTKEQARSSLPAPELKGYQSYRAFLKDWYEFKKGLRPGFSYRRFSQILGLKSPNFLQLVISNQRNLSLPLAAKFCRLNHFSAPERAYFLALVQFEDAGSEKDKTEAEKSRRIALRKLITNPMAKDQEEVFSRWHHMLVRELVFLPDFEPSGNYISRRLSGLLTPEEAEESLAMLKRSGFLVVRNGRLVPAEPVLDSGNSVFTHEQMQRHHGETLVKWGKNLEKLDPPNQELGLLHIPISSDKIGELKKRIRRFQDEIIGWLESEPNPDRVVQLGTYLIPFEKEREH
jgi:uncharacterized protein (TIGR02147 family)